MRDPFVKLSLAAAKTLDSKLHGEPVYDKELRSAVTELGRAVARVEWTTARKKARPVPLAHPKPDPKDGKAKKARAKDEHRERMRVIRGAIWIRAVRVDAGGRDCDPLCEKCGQAPMVDPHHLFGRGKGRPLESERNCVGLCRTCHRWMQHPPSLEAAAEGWDWAGRHLEALGFGEEAAMCWARAKKCRTRAELSRVGEAVRAAEVSRG